MKGIILAGGTGSRLRPITFGVSKHLLPVYDKPMIYYPLSVLMIAGIREVLIITTPNDVECYKRLIGNGDSFGIHVSYAIQQEADGIPSAFLIGEKFIGRDNVCLILGDNIFFGQSFTQKLTKAVKLTQGATLFCCKVGDPQRFGVMKFDENNRPEKILEKPSEWISDFAVTGLYFYSNKVVEFAKNLKPSGRGELEITDLNNAFLENENVNVELLGRGFTWIDAGTHDALKLAGDMIHGMEKQKNIKIACLEEVAFNQGWISEVGLEIAIQKHANNEYGSYLKKILHSSQN